MEPPAKRRRRGESQRAMGKDNANEEDEDELSFQPHEVLAKRDPGYRLSLERSQADQRFQATIAHIFEKYGRDFEGVGDEIDMMTGEIIVDNGHLRNMQNEGDVGELLYSAGGGDEDDDDDEGIRLEDLTDGEGDHLPMGFDDQSSETEQALDDWHAEDEEDRIMHGREPTQHSTSLVPSYRSGASSRLTGLLAGLPAGDRMGFGPSPLSFGASPFAFGASPLAAGPWDLPDDAFEPNSTSAVVVRPARAKIKRLPVRDKYNFPVQDGHTSIWAPRSKYKEDETDQSPAASRIGQLTSKAKPKPRKQILPVASLRKGAQEDDEDDEEAILAGKSSVKEQNNSSRTIQASDDEDEFLLAGPGASTTTSTKRKRKSGKDSPDDEAHVGEPGSITETQLVLAKSQSMPIEEESGDRRRSGRARKQVEFPGKISWKQALEKDPRQSVSVELPGISPESRHDYRHIETEAGESRAFSRVGAAKDGGDGSARPAKNGIIPDSQETVTSHTSNVSQVNASKKSTERGKNSGHNDVDSACVLSDDESPTWLSKQKTGHVAEADQRQVVNTDASLQIRKSGLENHTPTNTHNDNTAAGSESLRKRDRPKKQANISPKPRPDNTQAETADPHSKDPHPSKDNTNTIICKRNKPPRSRSSATNGAEGQAGVAELEPVDHGDPSYTNNGTEDVAVPFSSSPANELPGFDFEMSSDEEPRALTRELRWLQNKGGTGLMKFGPRRRGDKTYAPKQSEGSSPQESTKSGSKHTALAPERVEKANRKARDDVELDHQEDEWAGHAADGLDESEQPHAEPKSKTPQLPKRTPGNSPSKPTPSKSFKPQTPRHATTTGSRIKTPSSRRSILSLLSDAEDDEMDELGRNLSGIAHLFSSGPAAHRVWKSSALTTEVYHTPIKKRHADPVSPGSVVKTPGGTLRTCGVDGYRCGRDFCFTCL